jgi:hypothetical protein
MTQNIANLHNNWPSRNRLLSNASKILVWCINALAYQFFYLHFWQPKVSKVDTLHTRAHPHSLNVRGFAYQGCHFCLFWSLKLTGHFLEFLTFKRLNSNFTINCRIWAIFVRIFYNLSILRLLAKFGLFMFFLQLLPWRSLLWYFHKARDQQRRPFQSFLFQNTHSTKLHNSNNWSWRI